MAIETRTEIVKVQLPDGYQLRFETSQPRGEQDIVDLGKVFKSEEIAKTIEGAVTILKGTFDRIKPDKASVKFGLKVAIESGELTALIVKGTGEGNLEITIEWAK
jgi:Trypsin-co-occurring domain 1